MSSITRLRIARGRAERLATIEGLMQISVTFHATDLRRLATQYPDLSDHGFKAGANAPIGVDHLPTINRVAEFLVRHTRPTRAIKQRRGSYAWKHVAEEAIGVYVPNGVFIATAILLGHKIKRLPGTNPNCWLNLQSGTDELHDLIHGRRRGLLPGFATPADDELDVNNLGDVA